MAEMQMNRNVRVRRLRHRERGSQVLIYLGKQLRFFVNESGWKVLPMAAVIAALVCMVIRRKFFINMEGGLFGGFALTCMAIWNGCFNSIQSVCRERAIVKREHRSGMHVSSYVLAHMIYQLGLCAAQTGLSLYVMVLMGVQFPLEGFMTPWMLLDVGFSMLLITYASDMMSLFISSVAHTTTGAMTVMPFILIFQLVFSGGLIPLPAWSQRLSNFTISSYGIRAITAQSGYNELPMVTGWNVLSDMRDNEIGGTVTLGQLMDLLESPAVEKRRDTEVIKSFTVGEAADILASAEESLHLREKEISLSVSLRDVLQRLLTSSDFQSLREQTLLPGVTLGNALSLLASSESAKPLLNQGISTSVTLGQVLDFLKAEEIVDANRETTLNEPVTLGQIADFLTGNPALQAYRDRTFTINATVGDLLDLFGEENVKTLVQQKTAAASQKEEYARTMENITENWLMLGLFILVFAFLAMLSLELIDKDKR